MAEVTLDNVVKVYPDGTVAVRELSLEVADGEMMVFVGPSGCGKTTALRMVAGLEQISGGAIRIGDRVVNDLPPRERDVAMVFQNYALYPHKTVYENLAFPLKLRKLSKSDIDQRVQRIAGLLELEDLLLRRPGQLSGGQRQRVAMGRAIVREPRAFLMDEPLSNLDAKLRSMMRAEISLLHKELKITTIYVTHDQVEAMTLGDRVAVMRGGELQQVGAPQDLYDRPANSFVAGFIGSPAMNFLSGTITELDDGVGVSFGKESIRIDDVELRLHEGLSGMVGRDVIVGIRPEHGQDAALVPQTPADRRFTGLVQLREALGAEMIVHLLIDAAPVVSRDVRDIAHDIDEAAIDELDRLRQVHRSAFVVRFDAGSRVRDDHPAEVAVRAGALRFFDTSTGHAVGA